MSATVTNMFDDAAATDLSNDELERRVLGHAAQIAALTGRFLDYLGEFDARGAWMGPGMHSCAQWLSWRAGMSLRTAQEHLRVARALPGLPMVREHLLAGRLSFSKVRALTRVGTPEREPELVNFALSATAAQLDRLVGTMPKIDNQPDCDDPEERTDRNEENQPKPIESYASWRWNEDGSLRMSMCLNPVDAAHVLAGLVRAEYERTRVDGDADLPRTEEVGGLDEGGANATEGSASAAKPHRDLWRNVPTNVAPALVMMADTVIDAVSMPEIAPGAEILVHETPEPEAAGRSESATAHLDEGPILTATQRDELRCNASVRSVGHDSSRYAVGPQLGPIVWWGRKRRFPNPALTRTVYMRDRFCRAPGCGRTRGLHIHHVLPWSQGGTTDPDNLILLCAHHHRMLHDDDFVILALGKQRFRFQTTAGSELKPAPAMLPGPAESTSWNPDARIAQDALTPEGNGPLDLGYATEVLYAIWDRRARERRAADHATNEPVAA